MLQLSSATLSHVPLRRIARDYAGQLAILAVILAVAGAGWIFLEIADEVLERESDPVDRAILTWVLALGHPDWMVDIARDVTALGSTFVLSLVVAVTALFLLLNRCFRACVLVVVSAGVGMAISHGLKLLFARERPDIIPHEFYVATASFPSGHAMLSAVTYLTLGALIAELVPQRRLKLYVMAVAAVLTGLVGLSRLYLGVHWPTDVLAGWAAGAAWALACWGVARFVFPPGPADTKAKRRA